MWVDIANLVGPRGEPGQDGAPGEPGPINIGLDPESPIGWDQSGGFTFNFVDGSEQTVNLPIASAQSAGLQAAGGELPSTGVRDVSGDVRDLVSGAVTLHRSGPIVVLVFSDAVFSSAGNNSIYTLPRGFRPPAPKSVRGLPVFYQVENDYYARTTAANAYYSGGFWLYRRGSGIGHLGTCVWTTPDDWPDPLPGTGI